MAFDPQALAALSLSKPLKFALPTFYMTIIYGWTLLTVYVNF